MRCTSALYVHGQADAMACTGRRRASVAGGRDNQSAPAIVIICFQSAR